MSKTLIDQILHKVQSIPSLPAAVTRLCQLAQDPEADSNEIVRVISTDEVLTSRILRAANSAYYGLSQRISTVSQAVVILGLQAVRNLALGVTVFGIRLGADPKGLLSRENLWRHSLAVAIAAREVSSCLGEEDIEEAFTAGFLHDLGKVVLMEFFYDQYLPVLQKALEGTQPLHVLEEQTFGIHHAGIGRELCHHWKIPPPLATVVAQHHRPMTQEGLATKESRQVFAVRAADNLARIARIGNDGETKIGMDFLHILDTEEVLPEHLRQILLTLPEEVRKCEVFFDLAAEQPPLEHATSPCAGVFISNPKEREVIRLLLLTMGYSLPSVEEIRGHQVAPVGVVVDGALPPDLRETFEQRGTPVLDFGEWKQANGGSEESRQLNIQRLEAWLREKLPQS
jgi:putative nucleotidyltransferase with HDIG domain